MFKCESLVSAVSERLVPSGGVYPDCEEASQDECCLAQMQIHYSEATAAERDAMRRSSFA